MRILDYINQGGVIMYILVGINIIGIALMLYKFFELLSEKKRVDMTATALADDLNGNNNFNKENTSAVVELSRNELTYYMSKLEKGLNTIKIIAAISPLLGLLGTVIGVLMSFSQMAKGGMGDPSSFANGISLALITTVGGLIVAIPHYIGHNYLLGNLDELESHLEKQLLNKVL